MMPSYTTWTKMVCCITTICVSFVFVFVCLSFTVIIRKLYSLLCSLCDCNNLLICAMLHSDVYLHLCLRAGISCYMYFSLFFSLNCFYYYIICPWASSLLLKWIELNSNRCEVFVYIHMVEAAMCGLRIGLELWDFFVSQYRVKVRDDIAVSSWTCGICMSTCICI